MAEVNEEAAEVIEEIVTEGALSPRELRCLLGGIGIGLLGGAVVASIIARRRLETKYMKLAEEEIHEMREHFAKTRVGTPKPELDELVTDLGYSEPNTANLKELEDERISEEEAIAEVVREEEAEAAATLPEDVQEEVEDLAPFKETSLNPDNDWDYEKELAGRSPDKPYIIHMDERHETDYTESTLIYYEADDVLCDTDDSVVDKELVVGEINLEKFGFGSGDMNILFIRNDVLAIEVEVVRNDGKYAEVVHGLIQHSDTPVRRRKRTHDEE